MHTGQFCNEAFCEHTRATVVGCQQRMRSRRQDASGSSSLHESCAAHAVSQSSSGTTSSMSGEKLLRAEMIYFAVDSERRLVRKHSSLGRMKN